MLTETPQGRTPRPAPTRRAVLHSGTGLLGVMAAACAPASGTAPAATAEPAVRLTYLHQWSQSQGHGPATDQLAARFGEQFPGNQVESVYATNYFEKLGAMIASGDPPDVATDNLAFFPQRVRTGAVVPAETLAKGAYRFDKNDMVAAAREMVTFDGKVMALPYILNNTGMAFNQTLFTQKGLDPTRPPATWADVLDAGRRLTGGSGETETWGIQFPRGTADPISPLLCLLWQNGGEVVDLQRRVATWNSPAGVEALQFTVDLVHKHRIASLQAPGDGHLQGRIGMWLTPPGSLSIVEKKVGDQFKWSTGVVPTGKQRASSLGGHALLVMKTNRHHERAWRFVHWFTSPPIVVEFNIASTTPPPWRSAERQPVWQRYLKENPRMKPFIDMLAYGRPTPKVTTWQDIVQLLVDARESAAAQRQSPKAALDEAARLADPLLKDG